MYSFSLSYFTQFAEQAAARRTPDFEPECSADFGSATVIRSAVISVRAHQPNEFWPNTECY